MSFTGLRQPITQVIRVKFEFPANSPAGSEDIGQVETDPSLGIVENLTVPSNEIWHIVDVYAESVTDIGVDGYLDIIVNDLRQNLRFGPFSQTLKTLLAPLRLRQAIVIDRLSKVNFIFKTRAPVGSSSTSTTITVELVRVPVG